MTSFLLPLEVPSTEAALRDAKSESAESRWVAAMALGRTGQDSTAASLEALVLLASDPVDEVRAQAIEGLLEQKLGGVEVQVKLMVEALGDPAPCVRCAAIDAVAVSSDEDPEDDIAALLTDGDPSVRAAASRALGELGSADKIENIVALLDDEDAYVALEAAIALSQLGDPRAEAKLISALEGDPEDALDSALGLGRLGLKTSAPALRKVAARMFVPVDMKAMVAAALVRCSDPSGLPILLKMLLGHRQSTRMIALTVLARLPVSGIEDAVLKLARSEREMEASAAAEILEIIERELFTD